jgi:flagellar biosynthetic protein FlhB
MSGGSDKTEKPTGKRVARAREQGQVAKSADLNSAVVLGAAALVMSYAGASMVSTLIGITQHLLGTPYVKPFTLAGAGFLVSDTLRTILLLMLPFLLATLTAGVLINLIQVKPLFTLQPLMPKLSKLNPLSGFQRFWSLRSIVELVKSLAKMLIIGGAGWSVIQGNLVNLLTTSTMDLSDALHIVGQTAMGISVWAFILMLVIGILDFFYQRYALEKSLRMTKQEVRDEHKESEGNPEVKGKIKAVGREMVRKRQLAAVPKADVIVVNPTHYSVAIQYDPEILPAPRVIAKGVDHFALKIREVAKENNVPIVENVSLARSLYAAVDVDRMIPPELFVAVAEVLAYVFSKNKGRKLHKKRTDDSRPRS